MSGMLAFFEALASLTVFLGVDDDEVTSKFMFWGGNACVFAVYAVAILRPIGEALVHMRLLSREEEEGVVGSGNNHNNNSKKSVLPLALHKAKEVEETETLSMEMEAPASTRGPTPNPSIDEEKGEGGEKEKEGVQAMKPVKLARSVHTITDRANERTNES